VAVGNIDRLLFVGLYRTFPKALTRSKSSSPRPSCVGIARVFGRIGAGNHDRASAGQRRQTPVDIRQLIRKISVANPLWGAPRFHGELLKPWHRCRPDDRSKIYGKETAATIAGLEDLPSQSY